LARASTRTKVQSERNVKGGQGHSGQICYLPVAIVPSWQRFQIVVGRRIEALDCVTIVIAFGCGRVRAICHAELPTKAAQIRQLCLLAPLSLSARNERICGFGWGGRRKNTHATRVATAGVRKLAHLDHGNIKGCGGGGTVVGNAVGSDEQRV